MKHDKNWSETHPFPYKIEPGEMPPVERYEPDPRPKWQRRIAYLFIGITIALCLAAIFVR